MSIVADPIVTAVPLALRRSLRFSDMPHSVCETHWHNNEEGNQSKTLNSSCDTQLRRQLQRPTIWNWNELRMCCPKHVVSGLGYGCWPHAHTHTHIYTGMCDTTNSQSNDRVTHSLTLALTLTLISECLWPAGQVKVAANTKVKGLQHSTQLKLQLGLVFVPKWQMTACIRDAA